DPPKQPILDQPLPLYPNARIENFPTEYGIWNLEGGFNTDGALILVYGRRFLVKLNDDEVEGIIDLKPLLGVDASKTDVPKEAANTPAFFVTIIDGVVYATVNTLTSTGSAPPSSYVVALDPFTGKVLWRSASGVVPRAFVVFGDYLFTVAV